MISCLVLESEPNCSNYLTKEKDINLTIATSEKEVIESCKNLFPDVFIIDIDTKNLDITSIIEKINIYTSHLTISNIIVLYSDSSIFNNILIPKVFSFIHKKHISQLLLNTILVIANQKKEVWYDTDSLHQKVYMLQHQMNLPDITTGVSYLRKAVRVCYREPKYSDNLNIIYERVAYEIKEQAEKSRTKLDSKLIEKFDYNKIKWDIERSVNLYQKNFKKNEQTLHTLFGDDFSEDDITPKKLIHAMVKYLRINVDASK